MPITDYERLLACDAVTSDNGYSLLLLQNNGWEPQLFSENLPSSRRRFMPIPHNSHNYKGLLLINRNKRAFLLVHRGMQLEAANAANCLMIGLRNEVPPIVEEAERMCDASMERARQHRRFELYHTGFSMGGFLAQMTASYCNQRFNRHNNAVGYDCPGAKHFIENRYRGDNRENVIVYLTTPNLVNTATPHYGYVRQVSHYIVSNGGMNYPDTGGGYVFRFERVFSSNFQENARLLRPIINTLLSHKQEELLPLALHSNNRDIPFRHVSCWPIAENRFEHVNTLMATFSQQQTTDILNTIYQQYGWGPVLGVITFAFFNGYINNFFATIRTGYTNIGNINMLTHSIIPAVTLCNEPMFIRTREEITFDNFAVMIESMLPAVLPLALGMAQRIMQAVEESQQNRLISSASVASPSASQNAQSSTAASSSVSSSSSIQISQPDQPMQEHLAETISQTDTPSISILATTVPGEYSIPTASDEIAPSPSSSAQSVSSTESYNPTALIFRHSNNSPILSGRKSPTSSDSNTESTLPKTNIRLGRSKSFS